MSIQLNQSNATKTVQVRKNSTLVVALPNIPKGTLVKETIKGPDGKTFTIISGKANAKGVVKSPVLKFKKPGTYTITITAGKLKKVVSVRVS